MWRHKLQSDLEPWGENIYENLNQNHIYQYKKKFNLNLLEKSDNKCSVLYILMYTRILSVSELYLCIIFDAE